MNEFESNLDQDESFETSPADVSEVAPVTPTKNTKFKDIKDLFSNRWRDLSKKKKVLGGLGTVIIFTLAALSAVPFSGDTFDFLKTDQDKALEAWNENWQKIAIDGRPTSFFELSAKQDRPYGVLPNETLILKTEQPVSQEFIQQNITSSVPVTVRLIDEKTFEIQPASSVGLDQLFDIKINVGGLEHEGVTFERDYSWAFQTQPKFSVISTIPANEATNVPVNTGIEFVFTQDDYVAPDSYISISPEAKFKTERRGSTLSIVPLDPLQEKTTYTVRMRSGFGLSSRTDTLATDYTFTFQTGEKQTASAYLGLAEDFHHVSPENDFQVKVFTANWDYSQKVKASIYQFANGSDFIRSRDRIDAAESNWFSYFAEKNRVDVSALSKVSDVELDVLESNSIEYLHFPEKFSKGFYIVELAYGSGGVHYVWVQSTSIAGYVSVAKEQSLVWANEVGGGPLEGASIGLVGGGSLGQTNEGGVARFSTPARFFERARSYVTINSAEETMYMKTDSQFGQVAPGTLQSQDYWSYFYNERKLYKPTDTIDFFGVIKNRASGAAPASFTASLHRGYYYWWEQRSEYEDAIAAKTINPAADGSFSSSFSFNDLPSSAYHIKVSVGNLVVHTQSFNITNYIKPEIDIEVVGDKKAIFAGEATNFSVTAKFFDNTPLVDTVFRQSGGNSLTEHRTDERGEFVHKYSSEYNAHGYYPTYVYLSFVPAISQEADVEGLGSVMLFGSRVMLTTSSSVKDLRGTFNAQVNNVDLSGINAGSTSEYKGTPVKDHEVEIKLIKSWYDREETGTYYDFVEKTTKKTYQYTFRSEELQTRTIKTDANGRAKYEFDLEEGVSYRVHATTKDKDGRSVESSEYYHSSQGIDRREEPVLNLKGTTDKFSIGATVESHVSLGDNAYPIGETIRFMFVSAQNGRQEFMISETPEYTFEFQQKHVPNFYLGAVIYTGEYYQKVLARCVHNWRCRYALQDATHFNAINVLYAQEDSEISLSIDASKSVTAPGGRAQIRVNATKDGVPVPNATVNLAIVDQALAAVGFVNEPSILDDLYKVLTHSVYYNYGTHEPIFQPEPAAEMGGGGGDGRELFKDTAFFGVGRTNSEGIAEFTFTLPDNITTWIIYSQALDASLNAGWNEGTLVATKDFFVTSQFPSKVLVRDNPILTGSSFGVGLNQADSVSFEALFYRGDTELSKATKAANAYRSVYFDFPDLGVGAYRATLWGRVRGKEDGLTLPFDVVESRFALSTAVRTTLEKGDTQTSLDAQDILTDRSINILVTDMGKGAHYNALKSFCYRQSNRLERQLAGIVASEVLAAEFEDECENNYEGITVFQSYDGGLAQVNWGSSNIETTAWVVSVDATPFDRAALISYFENILAKSNASYKEKVYAAWGLTELGRPQLLLLNSLKGQATTFEHKVILGLAYASLGDSEQALDLYYDIVHDYGYESTPYIRIQNPEEESETNFVTSSSYSLLLGELVDSTYNYGLGRYVTDFRGTAEHLIIDLSEISFIKTQLATLPDEDTTVYIKASNIETTQVLTKGRSVNFLLSSEDINDFVVEVLDGKAETYITFSVGSSGLDSIAQDDRLSLSREYEKVGGSSDSVISPGDLVKVTLKFDITEGVSPPGRYTVSDYVPSGFRYVANPYVLGLETVGWVGHADQVVSHSFSNSSYWRLFGYKEIVYYVRAASAGEFVAEPAILQSQSDLDILKSTPEEVLKVHATTN